MNEQNNNPAMNFNIPNGASQVNSNQTLASAINAIPTSKPVGSPTPVQPPVVNPGPTLASVVANTVPNPAPVTPVNLNTTTNNAAPIQAEMQAPSPTQTVNPNQTVSVAPVANQNNDNQVQTEGQLPQSGPASEIPGEEVPKKKISPIVLIALALVVLVIGGGLLYYFVLDTPKKIFTTAFDNISKQLSTSAPSDLPYTNIDLSANVSTTNKDFASYVDIINKIKINATFGNSDNKLLLNGTVSYSDAELLNINSLVDDKIAYIKASNLLDKVIKLDIKNNEETTIPTLEKEDYEKVQTGILNAISTTLKKANYKKELVSLNSTRATKSILKIDKTFLDSFYNSLTSNNELLESIAKITNKSVNDITEEMNKTLNEYENNDEELALYTTLLKHELLKLEFISSESQLIVTPTNNTYNYEIKEKGEISSKGYLRFNKNATNTILILNVQIPNDETAVMFSFNTTAVNTLEELDVTNAVDINALTETDKNDIYQKISNNDAFKTLLTDLGMTEKDIPTIVA